MAGIYILDPQKLNEEIKVLTHRKGFGKPINENDDPVLHRAAKNMNSGIYPTFPFDTFAALRALHERGITHKGTSLGNLFLECNRGYRWLCPGSRLGQGGPGDHQESRNGMIRSRQIKGRNRMQISMLTQMRASHTALNKHLHKICHVLEAGRMRFIIENEAMWV